MKFKIETGINPSPAKSERIHLLFPYFSVPLGELKIGESIRLSTTYNWRSAQVMRTRFKVITKGLYKKMKFRVGKDTNSATRIWRLK